MKTKIREVIKDEGGAALALTIILLLVGGLVIAPVLGHMGTGIKAGEVHEEKMGEVYAADAGLEHALWNMMTELEVPELSMCAQGDFNPDPYTFEVDGRTVRVKMEFVTYQDNQGIFKLTSEVFALDDVDFATPLTTIVSHVTAAEIDDPDAEDPDNPGEPEAPPPLDLSSLLDYALSSDGTITIQPNSEVYGDIYIEDPNNLVNQGSHHGDVVDSSQVQVEWPTAEQLSAYYFADVEHLAPFASGVIDIKNTKNVGPLYRQGALLIQNTGASATLTLDGTLYIAGDLDFAQPGEGGAYTINLNGQTIYVEGDVYFPPKFVSLTGSGAIIATGEIWFQPIMSSSSAHFVLVMSVFDQAWFNPSGDFYGAIAGEAHVQLQPNNFISWTDWRGRNINIPGSEDPEDPGTGGGPEVIPKTWTDWDVTSYNINPGSD